MAKTIHQNDSATQFFLDYLYQSGMKNREIDGAVANDAVGGPTVGQCHEPGANAKNGNVEKNEVFAVAFNNLTKHGDTVKRFFQKLGLKEIEHLQSDGEFAPAYRTQIQKELLGADPQRSLKAWPNPKKLNAQDPAYAGELLKWASRHTRLPLLPYKEQVEVLKQLGLGEAQVKGGLSKLWQGMTVPKMVAHASVLRGEELLREAKELRGVGDVKGAKQLERSAQHLFRTAVELDGKNPAARLHLAETLEGQEHYHRAGLQYAMALQNGVEPGEITQILEHLSGPHGKEMLGHSQDAFSFVGSQLMTGGHYAEAAPIFHRAAEAATEAGRHEKSIHFTEQEMLAQEAMNPYVRHFSSESNPVAHALYGALRDAGIPSALIDAASGREGDLPDRKISAAEVYGYLNNHQDDPRVKTALAKIHFQMPWLDRHGHLKKNFDTPEFSRLDLAGRMAFWHGGEAQRLQKEDPQSNAPLIEKHLKMAGYYEPDSAARQRALGDFYLAHKQAAAARDSYFAAVAADPGDPQLQLSLGRSLVQVGDYPAALQAYDSYLAKNPGDAPIRQERTETSAKYLGTLEKKFDQDMVAFHSLSASNPDQAAKSLDAMDATVQAIFSNTPVTPQEGLDRLKRLRAYYRATVDFRDGHRPNDSAWDSSQYEAYDAKTKGFRAQLKGIEQAMGEFRSRELLPALNVPAGATPTLDQTAKARVVVQLDRELGDNVSLVADLDKWNTLVTGLPATTLTPAERSGQLTEILKGWLEVTKPGSGDAFGMVGGIYTPAAVAERLQGLKAAILAASPAAQDPAGKQVLSQLLDRILEKPQPNLLQYLSADGLTTYAKQSTEADTAFKQAQQLGDVKERRGALLGVLAQYGKLGQGEAAAAVIKEINASFPSDAKDTDQLQMTIGMLSALKGSGLPQEAKLKERGAELARMMPVCAANPRLRVQRLLMAQGYYEVAGDAAGQKDTAKELRGVRDDLFNFLFFGNPKAGIPKPTDAKTRLDTASLAIELDMALLPTDAAEASNPKSSGAIAISIYADRLQVLRREIAAAKDLDPEVRLEKLALLGRAAAMYQPLTKGDKPLLAPDSLKKLTDEMDPMVGGVFAELMKQPDDATPAQKQMADKVVADLKTRYTTAVKNGEAGWLANVTPTSVLEFAQQVQGAHALLLNAGDGKGPRAMQLRLEAGQLFAQLGLKDRVKEAVGPLQIYAKELTAPRQRAGLCFTLAQLYQGAGMTEEANTSLQGIVEMGGPEASPQLRELGTLARGMQQLNRGEMKQAQETFATIPENPIAQTFLSSLREGVQQRRIATAVGVLRSVALNFLERGKDSTFGGFDAQEYEALRRDTMAGWDEVQRLMLSGESKNFDEAIHRVKLDGRFPNFRTGFMMNPGGDPHRDDMSEFHVAGNVFVFLSVAENPEASDLDFAKRAVELGTTLEADGYYSAAGQIYANMSGDPLVGKDAKDLLDDLPASIKVRTGIGVAWNVISFATGPAGIIGANSTSGAGGADYVENVAMALIPFGVARAFAVGAEAVYAARAASLIRNPMLFKAGGFLVSKSAEAAGFTLGNMAMLTLLKGKTDQWTLSHFGTEFGSMLVTFVLLHGAGMALQGIGRLGTRSVASAEADLARALESGGGFNAAVSKLRWARGAESVAKSGVTAWGTRVLAFTGAEYFNEAIGLKNAEPGIPFGVRLFTSAVMDAQMIVAGRTIDAVSRGRLGKVEKATQQKYLEHQVGYETQQLLPVVQGMGLDPQSPAGRYVLQGLVGSRMNGESLASIQSRTSAEERATYEQAIAKQWGVDPKSPAGRQAMALLLGYAQLHPFAVPGKPLGAAEVVELAGQLNVEATKLLRSAGLERGPGFEALRQGVLAFAMQTGMEPAGLGLYAEQASSLKAPVRRLVNQVLGPDAAKTPEGQSLMGELTVFAMLRAESPSQLVAPLEPYLNAQWGTEVQTQLHANAEALFGRGGEETPAGRAWMARLFRQALNDSQNPAEIGPALARAKAMTGALPALATVTGFTRPMDKLALSGWALEHGADGEVLHGMVTLILKGKLEMRAVDGKIQLLRVPSEQQAARAKDVLDRLPELDSALLKEDRNATRRAEEEIIPITDDMILPDKPPPLPHQDVIPVTDDMIVKDGQEPPLEPTVKVSYTAKTQVASADEVIPITDDMILPDKPPPLPKGQGDPAKKVATVPSEDQTTPGRRITPQALAARRAAAASHALSPDPTPPAAGDSIPADRAASGSIPKVSITTGDERWELSFKLGDTLRLGNQNGNLVHGPKVKEPLAEIQVQKDADGNLVFNFRRIGEAEGKPLQAGDKVKVGDAELLWEGPETLEKTQKGGVPGGKRVTAPGRLPLSSTEINAHAFLDFYYGEGDSLTTLKAVSARNQDGVGWPERASTFLRRLESFKGKVEKFDALEKEFLAYRKTYMEQKTADPAKAQEASIKANEVLRQREEMEKEISLDLGRLQTEPYNRVEVKYNETISKAEGTLRRLNFALAEAEVQSTVEARGTKEKPAVNFELVFTPLADLPVSLIDNNFKGAKLQDLAHGEVSVSNWEAAKRTLDGMVREGVLDPQQIPDMVRLQAEGKTAFTVKAQTGEGDEVSVNFSLRPAETKVAPSYEISKPENIGGDLLRYAALEGGKEVGNLTVKPEGENGVFIGFADTPPENRGNGVFKALFAAVTEGKSVVRWKVIESNTEAALKDAYQKGESLDAAYAQTPLGKVAERNGFTRHQFIRNERNGSFEVISSREPAPVADDAASPLNLRGGNTVAAVIAGLTTLFIPAVAHAGDQVGPPPSDGSIVPWVLGIGAAALVLAGGAFYYFLKGRPRGGETDVKSDPVKNDRDSSDVAAQEMARRGRAGLAPPMADEGPVVIPTAPGGVGNDLQSFLSDRTRLSDRTQIPGLSKEGMRHLEKIFEQGGGVQETPMPGNRRWMLMEFPSGAATMNARPATDAEIKFYDLWKKEQSFAPVDLNTADRAWKELSGRAQRLGISIQYYQSSSKAIMTGTELMDNLRLHGSQFTYLNELMKMLPDSMLKNLKLKNIMLNTDRHGAGLLSSYDENTGSVYLYSGSFGGSRRHMAALFFHELGHSTAERYQLGNEGDPKIPADVREKMNAAHGILAKGKGMLGLDWADGAQGRAAYQSNFTEFLAELNLTYVVAGPKLRAHIESFPQGSPEREAWDFVYGEMKNRIFDGIEYDYDKKFSPKPRAPLKAVPPDTSNANAKTVILPVPQETVIQKPPTGPVQMALQDNVPGKGRQGSLQGKHPTSEYGTFAVHTDEGVGYKDNHNEDGYVQGSNWGLVLDGMGGMGDGDKASAVAGKKFAEEMAKHGDMAKAMVVAGQEVNRVLIPDPNQAQKPGAVAVAHQIIRNPDGSFTAQIVHVGDAGAMVFRKNAQGRYEAVFRTEEQSAAAEARNKGALRNTMEMRISHLAHIVSGGLGSGIEANPVVNDVPMKKGDVILSFSDGIGDNCSPAELAHILDTTKSPTEVATKITTMVHLKMQRLDVAKELLSGKTTKDGRVGDFVDVAGEGQRGAMLNDMPGYFINKKGHVYGRAVEFRGADGTNCVGVEVPWAKGQYYSVDAQGEASVISGTKVKELNYYQNVDRYKADNLTIHVYSHDLDAKSKTPTPANVHRTVVSSPDANTVILKRPVATWTPSGEWFIPTGADYVLVGKDHQQGAQITLRDPQISPIHAEIFFREGEYWVRDKASQRGTLVNGRILDADEAFALSDKGGDIVDFGGKSYQFSVVDGGAKLTPVLRFEAGSNEIVVGPLTIRSREDGMFMISSSGNQPVTAGKDSIPLDGGFYRLHDKDIIKVGQQVFVFRGILP